MYAEADHSTARIPLPTSKEKLQQSLAGIIQAMALIIESRDKCTAGHQQRVADFAGTVAQEMGLPDNMIDGVRMAAMIHDLGKISIPAEILSKSGKIIDIEFRMIQNHPQAGYDILKGIDFPWPLAQIVLQHHERLDGSGYPFGLSGRDILPEAKIIAVADVIEAMASHRPYRAALGIDKAITEVSTKKGTAYDQDVVNASIHVITKRGFLFH